MKKNELKFFTHIPYQIIFIFLALSICLQACNQTDDNLELSNNPVQIDELEVEEPTENNFTPIGEVEILNNSKIDDNYILVNNAGANKVFLITKEAELIYEWPLTNNIGNDVFLLPNGKLIASLEADEPKIKLGGKGGKIQIINPDGTVEFNFDYSSLNGETHHDVELLPNGNILAMVWEEINASDAQNEGFILNENIYPESIIEIDTTTKEIVWQWRSMDHIIQENDTSKENFGIVVENPHLIDINYTVQDESLPAVGGDIMHANAITYDEANDVILLSVNSYSEIWAIDHSTTTAEASSQYGGNYGKGGNLIYRFGNPEAYQNSQGTRLFYNNHYPNLLKGDNLGKLLVFSNGNNILQSTVYEFELPPNYSLQPNQNNEPTITWSFTDPELYSGKVSGAVILENGNILITEGDFGFWEVTREKEVVWKLAAEGFFWRAYHYQKNAPEIKLLGL